MRNEKGLTLAEMLMSTAILAFAVAGMLGLFSNCLFLNSENGNVAVASSHAQYVLESIRNAGISGLQNNIESGAWSYSSDGISALGLTPLKSETIGTACGSGVPLEVNVTVSWLDRFDRVRSEYFNTEIAK